MGDLFIGGDALRFYLTGAAATGGYQPVPWDSLGGYRSTIGFNHNTVDRRNAIEGVEIQSARGNAAGVATIKSLDAGTLAYDPPGDTEGEAVAIAYNEAKILYGNDTDNFIRVRRFKSVDLAGTESNTLMNMSNSWMDPAVKPRDDSILC